MKFVNQEVKLINQEGNTLKDIEKHIEKCGRVCYKSEDRITEDSYIKFIEMLKNNKHQSPLEHGTVYFKCVAHNTSTLRNYEKWKKYMIPINYLLKENVFYNLFALDYRNALLLMENNGKIDYDFPYLYIPENNLAKRYTILIKTSRAIANEFVRHRLFSFSQSSTRYCNYSLGKFSNEIIYVNPTDEEYSEGMLESLKVAEIEYMKAVKDGYKPQRARDVLPLATYTELIMTGTIDQWKYFLSLRDHKDAHPDAQYLAKEIKKVLKIE